MATVVLVIHLMIAVALVAVVLLQKSEGGALGMGGGGSGGGGGGFLTGRGTANLLTRTTAALAGCFFMTSILLTIIANNSDRAGSIFDRNSGTATEQTAPGEPLAPETGGSLLDSLKLDSPAPLPNSPN
ncbi:MAG: preprotein translocase subunit SecG [Pseudomonadota bacterium]